MPAAVERAGSVGRIVRLLATTGTALAVVGCAHLDAVKAFGVAAARDDSYATAATAYRDSAVALAPYLIDTSPPPALQPAARGRQARAALQLRAALDVYFLTLARLAGADNAPPVAEIDRVRKNLKALSSADGLDAAKVDAATDLVERLVTAVLLPQQVASVRRLVSDGGPSAMALIDALRDVLASWRQLVEGDRLLAVETLDALSAANDAPPLAVLLARDRVADLRRGYARQLRTIAAADLALQRIAAGHAGMAEHLDDLSGRVLAQQLVAAARDLKTLDLVADLETP